MLRAPGGGRGSDLFVGRDECKSCIDVCLFGVTVEGIVVWELLQDRSTDEPLKSRERCFLRLDAESLFIVA